MVLETGKSSWDSGSVARFILQSGRQSHDRNRNLFTTVTMAIVATVSAGRDGEATTIPQATSPPLNPNLPSWSLSQTPPGVHQGPRPCLPFPWDGREVKFSNNRLGKENHIVIRNIFFLILEFGFFKSHSGIFITRHCETGGRWAGWHAGSPQMNF